MNYGTEPMTYRYGTNISNTVPAGPTGLVQAYANSLLVPGTTTQSGQPYTSIFRAIAGEKVRFRAAHTNGYGGFPDNIFTVHGQVWQEEPYRATARRSHSIAEPSGSARRTASARRVTSTSSSNAPAA